MARLGNYKASAHITELSATDEDFANLSEAEQLQLLSAAQDEVCNLYFLNNRDDYKDNNLTEPFSAGSGTPANIRAGSGIATIAGTWIPFGPPVFSGIT